MKIIIKKVCVWHFSSLVRADNRARYHADDAARILIYMYVMKQVLKLTPCVCIYIVFMRLIYSQQAHMF